MRRRLVFAVPVAVAALLGAGAVLAWRFGRAPQAAPEVTRDTAAILDAAEQYRRRGEADKAEAVLRAAVGENPEDEAVRGAYAEALLARGAREESLEQYAWLVAEGSGSASAAFRAGSLAAALGQTDRAIAFHERAGALDPGNAEYPVHLAQAQIEAGRLDDAKASLARAAVLDEGRALVWGMLAELALRENKLEIAAQHIARARAIEPDAPAWRVVEARVLKRRGEPERALLVLSSLGEADRWSEGVLGTMAECLGMLSRPDDAWALYETAIQRRPGEPALRLEAALWAERTGRVERALDLARQAAMMGERRADAVVERLGG
jgi:tetratricopeptide (TPR) repeat protein